MKRPNTYNIIKTVFLIFALISCVLVYITAETYTNVMDARVNIPRNTWIQDVMIQKIDNESENARISVVFNVTNPTSIDIYVYDINYEFYMNDLSNPMDPEKPDTWDNWAVGIGGFLLATEEAIKVPSKSSKIIYANMTVMGDTVFMKHLNVTDIHGNYHPRIIATLRYTFKEVDIMEVVSGIYFYSEPGIPPKLMED